jgi:hypothetical protein
MKYHSYSLLAGVLVALASCVGLGNPPFHIGDPEATVIAALGNPAAQYQLGPERLLEYPTGPAGQRTYFARIGPDGKLNAYEQVLTTKKFSTIKVGEANKTDVLRTIGHPAETTYFSRSDLEVWSYRYKEGDIWNALMHVYFDRAGIVRKLENGPDPEYEREPREFHLGSRH